MTGDRLGKIGRDIKRLRLGRVRRDEPMARYTTFRVGGPADLSVWPRDVDALCHTLDFVTSRGLRVLVVGSGSHLLVPDRRFRGVVVHTSGLSRVKVDGTTVRAEAGATLRQVARSAQRAGLTGLEFAHDIPGRLGASVAINAGAYGGTMAGILSEVRVRQADSGAVSRLEPSACGFDERSSALLSPDCTVLSATFALRSAPRREIARTMERLAAARHRRQPRTHPTFGCMFVNPPGQHAGALLESAGVAGLRIGDAQVSTQHANFVLNLGRARFQEVTELMTVARQRVAAASGIWLRREVRVVSDRDLAWPSAG